jgi:hypothetical protein
MDRNGGPSVSAGGQWLSTVNPACITCTTTACCGHWQVQCAVWAAVLWRCPSPIALLAEGSGSKGGLLVAGARARSQPWPLGKSGRIGATAWRGVALPP